ncbi:phospholipase A [Agaribacterium sp. ZY112]|uniref:phospholipase A n=1 Tax=Agaribacterium sp. ZY112 TaxID=3233574 RepID=UPI0035242DAE
MKVLIAALLFGHSFFCLADISSEQTKQSYESCVLEFVQQRSHLTTDKIHQICKENEALSGPNATANEFRQADEQRSLYDPYSLTAHKPNYVMPLSYNKNHNLKRHDELENSPLQDIEIQFQVSVKFPLWTDIADKPVSLFAAYTNRSFWQAYNSDISAPFRDINHEPEVWLEWKPEQYQLGNTRLSRVRGGFVHQSNGRSDPVSRSWNRFYVEAATDWKDYMFSIKPWIRVPEDEEKDNNPDIEQYMGNFEFISAKAFGQHTVAMMLRNNLRTDNKGAVELTWSIPMGEKVKAYMMYFNGYGETMLNYDHRSERYSLGFVVADWL